MIQLYVLAGLIALCSALGFGFYKQVQANGIYKANEVTLRQTLNEQNKEFVLALAEKRRAEDIAVKAQQEKEVIVQTNEIIKYKIREVQINAKSTDCINNLMPIDVCGLFSESCDKRNTNRETIPSTNTSIRDIQL